MQSYFLSFSHFMVEMEKIKEKQVGQKLKIPYMLGVQFFLFIFI